MSAFGCSSCHEPTLLWSQVSSVQTIRKKDILILPVSVANERLVGTERGGASHDKPVDEEGQSSLRGSRTEAFLPRLAEVSCVANQTAATTTRLQNRPILDPLWSNWTNHWY